MGDAAEGVGAGTVPEYCGDARVATVDDRTIERDLADQVDVDVACEFFTATGAEDFVGLAVLVDEGAHVLDDAGDSQVILASHVDHANGDTLRQLRRSGDDEHVGVGQHLGQAHLHVAGARRHVAQQVIEVAPLDILQEVLDRPVQHEAAPHERRIFALDQETHGDDLELAGAHGLHVRRDLAALR